MTQADLLIIGLLCRLCASDCEADGYRLTAIALRLLAILYFALWVWGELRTAVTGVA